MENKKIIVVVLFILLLSQAILFGLNSVFSIKGKMISSTYSSNPILGIKIKKIWTGNFLIIRGKTMVSCRMPSDRMKMMGNVMLIDSFYNVAETWCLIHTSVRYNVIFYNNIFSALEAYIFDDLIDVNVDDSIFPFEGSKAYPKVP